MEDDFNEPSTSLLPLALAVLALVVGGAGLYFGLSASQALQTVEDLNTKHDTFAESAQEVAKLKDSVKILAGRNKELENTVSRLRAYGNERDKRLKSITESLDKHEKRLAGTVAPAVVGASQANTISATTTVTAGNYTIQSGDTLSSIASQAGVKLQSLLNANPGIDPRRLRIGQAITIPSN